METNELIKIWNTLAANNLIDKKLAQENIIQIINSKRKGLISKMKKKVIIDYVLYLSTFILIPLIVTVANLLLNKPILLTQFIGVFVVECYLLFMLLKSQRKLINLKNADYNCTLKDSFINFKNNYLRALNNEKWVAISFGYFIIIIALIQYFIHIGRIFPIDFSQSYSYLPVFLLLVLIILPFILKLEFKIRYSKIIKELNQTIDELNTEPE
jgi:membrane protease YdiL (CAAX protease family)